MNNPELKNLSLPNCMMPDGAPPCGAYQEMHDAYLGALEEIKSQQSKIDALMLEHCPDEMTEDQVKEWGDSQKVSECLWVCDDIPEDSDTYNTQCGKVWTFIDGGIEDNEMIHCHSCGRKIIEPPKEQ